MTGGVSFTEFSATDATTARTVYGTPFDWSFKDGPGGHGYVIDGVGMPAGVRGDAGASPYVFFRVDDLDAAVESLGGTADRIAGADDEASDGVFGGFRLCPDDQGSPFALHRPPRDGTRTERHPHPRSAPAVPVGKIPPPQGKELSQ